MSTKLKAGTATSGAVIDADTTGILELQSGSTPTTAITVDTSQNVGIGTASPAYGYKLSVNGTGNFYAGVSGLGRIFLGDPVDWNGYIGLFRSTIGPANYNTGGNALNFAAIDGYSFSTGGAVYGSQTERMRIDDSGNFFVGGTTQRNGTKATIENAGNALGLSCSTNTASVDFALFYANAGTICGAISRVGTTSAVVYTATSDYRLKENIQPFVNALDSVSKLKPCNYTWKDGGASANGFIAHELQEVCPDAVVGEKDAVDEDGNPKYQAIDQSKVVALLTAAIQEQQALITDLTTRLSALEAK